MSIIITKNGKNAEKIDKSGFAYEDRLQQYIDDNPESIPLYEIKEDIRVLVLAREFETGSGPIDAIGIDKDGDIYIIETKLYKNADKRKVVAQVLDYGASLWKSSIDFSTFTQQIDTYLDKKSNQNTAQKIKDFYEITDEEVATILERVQDNLNHGKFKFVILMDQLDSRLKDLILFINENSKFDIYMVEFDYYQYNELEIIIPKLFGAAVKKDINVASQGSNRLITKDEFFNLAQEFGPITVDRLQILYDLSQKDPFLFYWGTKTLNIKVKIDGSPYKVLEINPNGKFYVNFLEGKLRERLSKILLVNIDRVFDLEGLQNNPERKFKGALKSLSDVSEQEFNQFIESLKNIIQWPFNLLSPVPGTGLEWFGSIGYTKTWQE